MGFMRAATIHTLERGVVARTASHTTSGSGASVSSSRVGKGTPPACGLIGAFVAVVTKARAGGTLGEEVEQ